MASQRHGTELDATDEEELLLIVSGMGTFHEAHDDQPAEYWIGEDCKECVADLQRYLRRDDPMVLAAHRALGSWRVLQQHLIPLLRVCSESDPKLCFNVLKVVVKLTMKPEQLAYKMVDHLKEKKQPDPIIGARMDELRRSHSAYKRAFARSDAMGSVVRLLARPLSLPEDERSDDDAMSIELLFALALNLLHTAHPDEPPPEPGRAADVVARTELLRSLLVTMDREHALELVLYVLQQIEEPGALAFRSLNLTLLEITYYVLSAYSPTALYAVKRAGALRAGARPAHETAAHPAEPSHVTLESLTETESAAVAAGATTKSPVGAAHADDPPSSAAAARTSNGSRRAPQREPSGGAPRPMQLRGALRRAAHRPRRAVCHVRCTPGTCSLHATPAARAPCALARPPVAADVRCIQMRRARRPEA